MVADLLYKSSSGGKKLFALLADPDDCTDDYIGHLSANKDCFDLLLFGGSLILEDGFQSKLQTLKRELKKPVILFPGDPSQVSKEADAVLLLSLISGRNPDLLIGRHVQASVAIKRAGIEVIPTGYILIDSGRSTSVSYISNTQGIPADKPGIAAATALAGEQLGLKAIYLEAGSGALQNVSEEIVRTVKKMITIPLIAGGGVTDAQTAERLFNAGADMLVVGNGAKKNPELIREIHNIRKR